MQNMFSNITSAFGILQKPDIPVRIPNDDTSFNPKEYPNVIVSADGKMSGKVLLVHGGTETDETGLGLISTRVWVVNEADKEQVVISASFDQETHTYHLQVCSFFVCAFDLLALFSLFLCLPLSVCFL
jgi:hypothetical protein